MAYLLVTGGAGYIGSHTLVELVEAGYQPVVVDNFCNSSQEAVRRVEKITGAKISLVQGDIRSPGLLETLLSAHKRQGKPIECVLHLAGLKAVAESVQDPLKYFDNNVGGTIALLQALRACAVRRIVFSSSATVYGGSKFLPITESHPLVPINPYGRTKLYVEQLLKDLCAADPSFSAIVLRYFNPIGAHPSGLIGENPRDIPNNLFPYITQVAAHRQPYLKIFGDNYETEDGTGVRDYLHVVDLAIGHVKAVDYILTNPGYTALNLGTGKGTSVKTLVQTFKRVTSVEIPYQIAPRRPGDADRVWADPTLAREILQWETTRDVAKMCEDGWRWQQANPFGYEVPVLYEKRRERRKRPGKSAVMQEVQ
jgi:UDP-glucose 4-epimerase